MEANYYNPSYSIKIDQIISKMCSEVRIIYLESDYPDILDMALMPRTGSVYIREWLNIRNSAYSEYTFQMMKKKHIARPLSAVYEEHGSYGILRDSEYYRAVRNIKAEKIKSLDVTLSENESPKSVVFHTPDGEYLKLSMGLTPKREPSGANKQNNDMISLPIQGFKKYIMGKKYMMFLRSEEDEQQEEHIPIVDSMCHLFYLTNADVFSRDRLALMIQAFLENRELYPNAKLILTGTTRCIPPVLSGQVTLIHIGSPSSEDIKNRLNEKIRENMDDRENEPPFTGEEISKMVQMLKGLTYLQIENIYSTYPSGTFVYELKSGKHESLAERVWHQKELENEKDGTLIYKKVKSNPGIVGIGGFMRWLNENLPDLADPKRAEEIDIVPPTGVILAGVPGTGKSQLAKQMAYQWERYDSKQNKSVSLIEFKIGNLSSSRYGESEAKMEKFLCRVSEQSPAILFVDEVEKTFYREEQGKGEMHEVKKQQMGMFLSWLQEHDGNIFTFMTSNDIGILPPELIRSGRLSERFFVFMPNYVELMSMMYAFLRDKATKEVFCSAFNQEILEICQMIDRYSEEYGRNLKDDADLDQELFNRLKESSQGEILNRLARYAINPFEDDQRKEELNQQEKPWTKWMKDRINMRTPFLTGADMKELVKNAMLRLRRRNPEGKGKWNGEEFADAVIHCCCCAEFTPYGQSNMDKLVDLYLSCDYRDASAHPLFPRVQFNGRDGVFARGEDGYIADTHPEMLYDQYLQQSVMQRIEECMGEKKRKKDVEERQERLQIAQESHLEFQQEQIDRQKSQWKHEDDTRKKRQKYEENVWELQELQLKKFKDK